MTQSCHRYRPVVVATQLCPGVERLARAAAHQAVPSTPGVAGRAPAICFEASGSSGVLKGCWQASPAFEPASLQLPQGVSCLWTCCGIPPSRPLHLLAWRGVERELPWRTRGDKRPDSMSPVELCNTALLLLGGCCGRRLAACSSNLCNAGVSGSWAAGPDLGCVPGAERVLAKQACRSTSFHCMLASVGVFCAHVAGCDVLGCVVAALCCTHARSMDWKTTWGCSCAAHRGLLRLLGQRSCVLQLGV